MLYIFAARSKKRVCFLNKSNENNGSNSRLFNTVAQRHQGSSPCGRSSCFQHQDALKYNPETKESAITKLHRVSTPGLRQYKGADSLPKVLNGLGIAILSTSKGVITDKEAKALNVGGEVLCYIY